MSFRSLSCCMGPCCLRRLAEKGLQRGSRAAMYSCCHGPYKSQGDACCEGVRLSTHAHEGHRVVLRKSNFCIPEFGEVEYILKETAAASLLRRLLEMCRTRSSKILSIMKCYRGGWTTTRLGPPPLLVSRPAASAFEIGTRED